MHERSASGHVDFQAKYMVQSKDSTEDMFSIREGAMQRWKVLIGM